VKAGDYVINELEPYASYELKMFAENTFGRSESSQLIGATTYESSKNMGGGFNNGAFAQRESARHWERGFLHLTFLLPPIALLSRCTCAS
jgi:hypothetical protein